MDELEHQAGDEPVIADGLSPRDKRALIFHLLYAADAYEYDTSLDAIVDNFERGFHITISKDGDIMKQVRAVIENRETIDAHYLPLLDNWRFDRLGIATKLILRFAMWEFLNTKTDAALIINEAVELAKCFAEKDAYKFVNGILDEYLKRKIQTNT